MDYECIDFALNDSKVFTLDLFPQSSKPWLYINIAKHYIVDNNYNAANPGHMGFLDTKRFKIGSVLFSSSNVN
jgi:hypothetical protein